MLNWYWLGGGWRKEHLSGTKGLVMMQCASNQVGHAHADPMTKYKRTLGLVLLYYTHRNVCTGAVSEKADAILLGRAYN
jgi:hypothetical protein